MHSHFSILAVIPALVAPAVLAENILFEGQKNQPLSAAEQEAFQAKLLWGSSMTDDAKARILASLADLEKLPTAREVMRMIIACPHGPFTIELAPAAQANSYGYAVADQKKLYINDKRSGDIHGQITILHELYHLLQNVPSCDARAGVRQLAMVNLLLEAETVALNFQILTESGKQDDALYHKNYELAEAKWLEIAKGKQAAPEGIPACTASSAEAQLAYAKQWASREMRSQFITQFVYPISDAKEDLCAYGLLRGRASYMRNAFESLLQNGGHPLMFKSMVETDPNAGGLPAAIQTRNPWFIQPGVIEAASMGGISPNSTHFMALAIEAQRLRSEGEKEVFVKLFLKLYEEEEKAGRKLDIVILGPQALQNYAQVLQQQVAPLLKAQDMSGAIALVESSPHLDDGMRLEMLLEIARVTTNKENTEQLTVALRKLTGNNKLPEVPAARLINH